MGKWWLTAEFWDAPPFNQTEIVKNVGQCCFWMFLARACFFSCQVKASRFYVVCPAPPPPSSPPPLLSSSPTRQAPGQPPPDFPTTPQNSSCSIHHPNPSATATVVLLQHGPGTCAHCMLDLRFCELLRPASPGAAPIPDARKGTKGLRLGTKWPYLTSGEERRGNKNTSATDAADWPSLEIFRCPIHAERWWA